MMSKGYVNITFTTVYFNFDDYDKPIKSIFQAQIIYTLLKNYTSWMQLMVETNNNKTSDNRFVSDTTDSLTFYSTKNKAQRTGNPIALISYSIE